MSRSQIALHGLAVVLSLLVASSLANAATVDLAQTGQDTCYNESNTVTPCAGTGQDGEFMKGIPWPDPRFTNNGDGTITDNLTGLIWLQETACFGGIRWIDALAATNVLADGACGLSDGSSAGDWRMPNILELSSLANMGVTSGMTWLGSFGFTGLSAHGRWSSTTQAVGTATNVYIFQFNDQFMGFGLKTGSYRTWPVRGTASGPMKLWRTGQTTCYSQLGDVIPCAGTGQDGDFQAGIPSPIPRFTDNGDGTVTDHQTDLVWLKNAGCFTDRLWFDAVADANALADGDCGLTDGSSAGDWRLPNTWEITSLVDFSQYQPALPPGQPFTNFPNQYFWTSTTWPKLGSFAYMCGAEFYGHYAHISKSQMLSVWPVRDGNIGQVQIFIDGFESGDTSAWSTTEP